MISRVVAFRRRYPEPAAIAAIGLVFALWSIAPLVYLLARAAHDGTSITGADSALAPADQLRYFGWIVNASRHFLAANPAPRVPGPRVYLNPVIVLSGALHRLGVGAATSYLLWLPAATVTLVLGYWALIRRALADRGAQVAALVLALFYLSPLSPLLDWGQIIDRVRADHLIRVSGHTAAYWQTWGHLVAALGLGLAGLFAAGLVRLADNGEEARPQLVAAVAVTGLLAAWLYPWVGIALLAVVAACAVRRWRPDLCVILAIALAVPLAYYAALALTRPEWGLSGIRTVFAASPAWAVAATVLPLAVPAGLAVGPRSRNRSTDGALVWWLAGAVVGFILLSSKTRLGMIDAAVLPAAILAVRGWRRLRLPRWAGIVALALMTLPGMAYAASTFHDDVNSRATTYFAR